MTQTTINALLEILKILMPLLTLVVMFLINRTQNKIHDKQKEIGKQIDGQQTALMDMTAKANLEAGKNQTKDEVIEILKQTPPLEDHSDHSK